MREQVGWESEGGESNECTYQVLGESLLVGDGARVGEPELVAEHREYVMVIKE